MGQPFVVQLRNQPGELAHLARALCARDISITQIQASTAGNLACATIYTSCCDDDTADVLHSMGYSFVTGSTVIVEIEDSSCALGDLTDRLAAGGVHITGFCKIGCHDGLATWSLSTTNEGLARRILGLPEVEVPLGAANG